MRALTLIVLITSGCNPPDDRDPGHSPDLGAPADLAVPTDAALPGCGPMVQSRSYVWDKITLPKSDAEYAIDLNGDEAADNQFGAIVQVLALQNLQLQTAIDQAVMRGDDLVLTKVESSDPKFANDACGRTTYYNAVSQANPSFAGNGAFSVDTSLPPTVFQTGISAAVAVSPSPITAGTPVQVKLKIVMLGGTTLVTLVGARIQFDIGPTGLLLGQLNGAIPKGEVDGVLIPDVARSLDAQVQANPGTSNSKKLLMLFDTGDGAGGSCGGPGSAPKDGQIAICEVAGNAIIKGLLAPDVQMFQNGTYQPNPANTSKDSLSLGIAFTAVKATF